MDEGIRVGQDRPAEQAALRLCNLVAPSRALPKDQFKRELEKELDREKTEPWEIIHLKLYKSQIPVIERGIETAVDPSDKKLQFCFKVEDCSNSNARACTNGLASLTARCKYVNLNSLALISSQVV